MLTRDPKETQSMQERSYEPALRAHVGIDVHRIVVATESVQRRLLRGCALFGHGVRLPAGRCVASRVRRRPLVCLLGRLCQAVKPARSADVHAGLVVEDLIPRSRVTSRVSYDDNCRLSFV